MRIIKAIPILLCGLIIFTSCVKEELSSSSVAEGEPTLMKFSLSASYKNESHTTRIGTNVEDEKKFKDIRVLIFDKDGNVVTNYREVYPNAMAAIPDLTVKTYSGNNRSLYFVANTVDVLDQRLAAVLTLSDLQKMRTTIEEFSNGTSGKSLLMTSVKKDVDINPGTNDIGQIDMTFMAAKVTLTVKDNTPADHTVTILGWDVIDGANVTYVIPNAAGDANKDQEHNNDVWTTTKGAMPFDKVETNPDANVTGKKMATLTQYLFENRRRFRVDKALPPNPYPTMNFNDSDSRGKAWFAPPRATCIVIHAIHKTSTESKVIEARIFIGNDNSRNYDIIRGNDYQFTVTINNIDEISIDTNLEYANANFTVQTSAPLDQIDAHPDYRPFVISGDNGKATIEILDANDKTFADAGFDATWLKISPLNLMYHQVKQSGTAGNWQQDAAAGTFVRAKYIPHQSVRLALTAQGVTGWNSIPVGQEDDDQMSFANATYRMCYKIIDIPFDVSVVSSKTLCVYADEFNQLGGSRSAKVKVTFTQNPSLAIDEQIFTIKQNGYLSYYDPKDLDPGLAMVDKTPNATVVKTQFGVEQFEEATMQMNPGIPLEAQKTNIMQWGYHGYSIYALYDTYRNGYFMTANAVYNDVVRVDNLPTGFGLTSTSYRPMYGDGKDKVLGAVPIPNYTDATVAPYYYPSATANIYHPIYKSSALRYCHEKNRDINGDGIIDVTESKWYLPSQQELQMIWLNDMLKLNLSTGYYLWSSTENYTDWAYYLNYYTGETQTTYKNFRAHARCIRVLDKLKK